CALRFSRPMLAVPCSSLPASRDVRSPPSYGNQNAPTITELGEARFDRSRHGAAFSTATDLGLHDLHDPAHVARRRSAGLGNGGVDDLLEFRLGQGLGQVLGDDSSLGLLTFRAVGTSTVAERLGGLAPALGLASEDSDDLVVGEFPGRVARRLFGTDRRESHADGGLAILVLGADGRRQIGFETVLESCHDANFAWGAESAATAATVP